MGVTNLKELKKMGINKIDKGVEFIYWKLSYRRKFIRTFIYTRYLKFLLISIVFARIYSEIANSIGEHIKKFFISLWRMIKG